MLKDDESNVELNMVLSQCMEKSGNKKDALIIFMVKFNYNLFSFILESFAIW